VGATGGWRKPAAPHRLPKERLGEGSCLIDFNSSPNLPPRISQPDAYLVRPSGRDGRSSDSSVAMPRDGTYAGVGALRFFYAKPKKIGTVFTCRSVFLSLWLCERKS
jgi:hypothetical protein